MKKTSFFRCLTLLLCIIVLLTSLTVHAQEDKDIIKQRSFLNEAFVPQIDSLKKLYTSQGFTLLREASMAMESEYEMPVIFPLTQGANYQFVFIGEPTSKLYEVRMYDWNEKQVIYKKNMWGDVDGNIISFNYTSQFSEYHMMKPVQVNKDKKKKTLSGYVMLFRRTS